MNPENKSPKDLSDPTFGFADFRQQTAGGGLRWLATILALAAAGLFIWFLVDKDPPEVHFPIHLKGKSALWAVGGAGLIWAVLAIINWRAWSQKRRPAHAIHTTAP